MYSFQWIQIFFLHKSQKIIIQRSIGFTFKWNSLTKPNLAWVFRSLTQHSIILRTDQLIKNSILMEITMLSFVYMILLVFNIKKNSRKFPNKGKIRLLGGKVRQEILSINCLRAVKELKVPDSHMYGSRSFSSTD